MPRPKKPQMARVAPVQTEPLRPSALPLLGAEREEFRRIIENPVFVKAFRNARCAKPTAFVVGGDTQFGQQIGNNRLHEIRGWEAFEFALLAQVEEPKERRRAPEPNFPNAGTMDAEFSKPKST